jgi:phosphoglycerol transferase MdoB-like AlkP superfamily enzyme
MIFCVEIYLSFQFYSREPDFPLGIFVIDAANAVLRDIMLASVFMFIRKNIGRVKQFARDYRPVVIVATLWLGISITIISSLKLIFNPMTLISVLTGVINNVIFILLAVVIYTIRSNILFKALYFLSYLFTIFVFFSDTIYFFVTSSHIKKILFANLNSYSITGVIYTTDKFVLLGIIISFFLLMLLFRTPKKLDTLPTKNIGIIIMICVLANLINFTAASIYPKVLLANGFDEECEIEKARNLSRDMLSESVTFNLAWEFCRNEEKYIPAASKLQHFAFSEDETFLLNELGIDVKNNPAASPEGFPYEKIIVIVAESFHRDYMHFYNSHIPAEATPFLDSLWTKYPHVDHYYSSSAPTTQGLTSTFLSQVIYSDEQAFEDNTTLFKTLEKSGYNTVFLEATSQYYNDEFRAYKKRFGMNLYRAKEDLEKQGYTGSTGWGFHNDVMYEETIRLLEENRNNKIFMVTKTIDSHQPYPYCGFSNDDIPASIKEDPKNLYLKAIYWENMTLKNFFQELEKRDLLDDKTLVIVTSDHNPHPSQNSNYKRLGDDDLSLPIAPIPLVFVSKNSQPFTNLNSTIFASQIDFAPTLLGVLGIPTPTEFSGRNMLTVPIDQSYAIGCSGETIYYWSKDHQLRTDMYSGKNPNVYEKALIHWTQDLYVRYFLAHGVQ